MNLKMNSRHFIAAALLTLSAPALHAQAVPASPAQAAPPVAAAPAAPTVTLRYKFAVGQVRRYEYDSIMNTLMDTGQTGAGVPMNMTIQMVMRQTVKSIRLTDGAATISTQIEFMHVLAGGQEIPIPDAQAAKMKQPFTQVMLPTGKTLSLDVPALNGAGGPGMNFGRMLFSNFTSAAALPDRPVNIGDTWNGMGASTVMGVEVASTSTLASLDQKNGAAVATIHNTQTGTIDQPMTEAMPTGMKMSGQVAGESALLFDTSAGTVQASQGTSTTDMLMTFAKTAGAAAPPGMPSAMKIQVQAKFQMQRLSDTAAAPAQ